jgi:hypothetical protein
VINPDFQEFFASLNAKGVRYLLIGGVAYNAYASPRSTKDIDVWVEPTLANLAGLLAAIGDFGFPVGEMTAEGLARGSHVLMLGRVPNRIDVLTRPSGVEFPAAWERRLRTDFGGTPIHVIGIEDLIRAKQAAGRPQDLVDVAMLEEILRRRGSAGRHDTD